MLNPFIYEAAFLGIRTRYWAIIIVIVIILLVVLAVGRRRMV